MDTMHGQLISTACALLCAGIGSIYDVRERRFPNFVVAPAIVAGPTLHAVLGGWRGMGAGDVKLMTAVALCTLAWGQAQ